MDKTMIEEMAQCQNSYGCVCSKCDLIGGCDRYKMAEELYKAGYRKLGDNAIRVLRSAKDMEKRIRKETARKFADMVKEMLGDYLESNEDLGGKIDKSVTIIDVIGLETLDGEVVSKGLIEYIYEELVGEEDGN